eukprot:1137994-Pelagomonas_calceolata.AAC.1
MLDDAAEDEGTAAPCFAKKDAVVRKDKHFRLGVGSFREECTNYVEIIHRKSAAHTRNRTARCPPSNCTRIHASALEP